jgi:hypothetical protein
MCWVLLADWRVPQRAGNFRVAQPGLQQRRMDVTTRDGSLGTGSLKRRLARLYEGEDNTAHAFRYGLLVFDVVTILFIIASSFAAEHPLLEYIDVLFGIMILADFTARLFISRNRVRDLLHPAT